jgi:hypothetical protein
MSTKPDWESEPLPFGLWVEITVLIEHLSETEQLQLLKALGITPSDFEELSATFMKSILVNSHPVRSATFRAAQREASGDRAQALERFNAFLDGLNAPLPASKSAKNTPE